MIKTIPKFICSRCDKKKQETECFCEDCVRIIVKYSKKLDRLQKQKGEK